MRDVAELAGLIEDVSGHVFDDRELPRLSTVAEQRARICGRPDVASYVRWLSGHRDDPEWRQLLSTVTISESYLFRGPQQLRAIGEVVIPELVAGRRPDDELRLWSAACAKGEEAVTLAVVLTELAALRGRGWSVLATDVDESALDKARDGEYCRRAMSRVPPAIVARHFERTGDRFRARPHILERVTYRRVNLLEQPLDLQHKTFDVVLLRNVLIYFAPETQRHVVRSVANTLAPDGSLFLGPSESLRTVPGPLVSHHFKDCYCYRWPHDRPTPVARPPEVAGGGPQRLPSSPATVGDVVRQLANLRRPEDRARASETIGAAVERYPEDASLRALHGWIWEQSGNLAGAMACYRAALYLEPSLQQVRFLIAGCLRQLGRQDRARHELRTVLNALTIGRVVSVEDFERLGVPAIGDLAARCREALEFEPGS